MRAHSRSPHIICPRHSSLSWCQPGVSRHICTEQRAIHCRASCLASRIIIILIIILMSSGQLMITRVMTSQACVPTLWLMFFEVVGQQSSEKERFYPSCKSNFCRFNFSKICSNFQPICSLDIWLTIKLPFCPSLWPPAVPLQAAAACSNIFFSRDLQFSAAVYCPNYGRSLKS